MLICFVETDLCLLDGGGGNIGGEIVKVDILKFSADDHIQALKRTQVIATMKSLQQMCPLMNPKRPPKCRAIKIA